MSKQPTSDNATDVDYVISIIDKLEQKSKKWEGHDNCIRKREREQIGKGINELDAVIRNFEEAIGLNFFRDDRPFHDDEACDRQELRFLVDIITETLRDSSAVAEAEDIISITRVIVLRIAKASVNGNLSFKIDSKFQRKTTLNALIDRLEDSIDDSK